MKYYTRKGDEGYTSLLGNERVPKYAPRPEAYGTLDELSSALGLARATVRDERSREIILAIQRQLCQVMTELAATPTVTTRVKKTTPDDVSALERFIDALGAKVELPREFVIPGDTPADATLHLARAITRRAERVVARLVHEGQLDNAQVLRYLNRLSSLLFVLARYEVAATGVNEATPAKSDR